MKKAALLLLALLAFSGAARAQCTGSGLAYSCVPGTTPAQVSAIIAAASNNAVITFQNGNYTGWGAGNIVQLNNSKGVTLICASGATCTIFASGGTVIGLPQYATGTNSNLYRISGFTFNYAGTDFMIWFAYSGDCGTSGHPCIMSQVRIDHNKVNFSNTSGGAVFIAFADDASVLYTFGVGDHNTLTSPSSVQALLVIADTNSAPLSNALGTAQNFFWENNDIEITTMTNAGFSCADSWGSARIVWRYNTERNCLFAAHGVSHELGPDSIEYYHNNHIVDGGSVSQGFQDGYRSVHHQGSGLFLAFLNSFSAYSGKSTSVIEMLHYRDYPNGIDGGLPADVAQCDGTVNGPPDFPAMIDGNRTPLATYRGYPCYKQPGRDPATQGYAPMYTWGNIWSDTLAIVPFNVPDGGFGSPDYQAEHMVRGREYFDAVSASAQTSSSSPFDGTSGMGFGTIANRPTTCTTSTESALGHGAAGVGYFASDVGAQGTLYTCSATNTWTVYYTPYTYPHPLVGGTPPASVSFSPSSLSFGSVLVGSSPSCPTNCLTVTLTNTGTNPLAITTVVDSDATQFPKRSDGCAGAMVGTGGTCMITVQFVPTTTGNKSATLTVTSNAGSSPDVYSMAGVGYSYGFQQTTNHCYASATSGTTVACHLSSAPQPGDVVLVHDTFYPDASLSYGSTSDGTNAYTKAANSCKPSTPTDFGSDCIAYLIPTTASPQTITLTVTGGTCMACSITVDDFPVIGGSAVVDDTGEAASGTGAVTGPTVTVDSGFTDLLYGGCASLSGCAGVTGSWIIEPTGTMSAFGEMAEYQLTATTNTAVGFTGMGSDPTVSTGISFKFTTGAPRVQSGISIFVAEK